MSPVTTVLIFYLAVMSLVTVVVTCLDKFFARKNMMRVSEKALLLLAFFGGAFAEYVTMRIIRHKTLHSKFMAGLPLIMILHIALVFAFLYFRNKGVL